MFELNAHTDIYIHGFTSLFCQYVFIIYISRLQVVRNKYPKQEEELTKATTQSNRVPVRVPYRVVPYVFTKRIEFLL